MIIADTDVLIDYISGMQPAKDRIAAYIHAEQLQTTVISCFELLSGAEGKKGNRIRELLMNIPIMPLDRKAAEQAAELRRELEGKGQYIGMGDSLISGIALTLARPLFTRNRRHFERVPNLKLVELDYTH